MKLRIKSAKIQYAVIVASRTQDSPELLVLAYADEKPLRSLIEERSILTLGFASRSEADAAIVHSLQRRLATQQMRATSEQRNGIQRLLLALHFCTSRVKDGLTNWKNHSAVYRSVQCIFATAVVIVYSRNILSATIRAALGF